MFLNMLCFVGGGGGGGAFGLAPVRSSSSG